MNRECQSCKHFLPVKNVYSDEIKCGECRRNAPVPTKHVYVYKTKEQQSHEYTYGTPYDDYKDVFWPRVNIDDWCSQFESK